MYAVGAREIKSTKRLHLQAEYVGNKQKGRSQNWCFKKAKHAKLSEKRACAYQGVRNVCFPEILACFAFLKHPFWDSPFCLIPGEQ